MSPGEVASLWQSRFGIPEEVFAGYSFYRKAQSVWVCSNAVLPGLGYETIGLRMISLKDRPWKPTTSALRIFGKHATKNLVCLTLEQAKIFMAGGSQIIQTDKAMDSGYVVVMYKDNILGCGLYSHGTGSRDLGSHDMDSQDISSHDADSHSMTPHRICFHGKLISQIPKESRITFEEGEDI